MTQSTNYTEVAKRLVALLNECGDHNISTDFFPAEGIETTCLIDAVMTYEKLGEYIRLAHDHIGGL